MRYFRIRLAAHLKLPVPHVEMRLGGATAFLLVEHYEWTKAEDGINGRLHQEGFCPALSVIASVKLVYEVEGGPGIERSLGLTNRACARPVADRLQFIRMMIFHFLVGNLTARITSCYGADALDLAPIYDVGCTAVPFIPACQRGSP